MMTIYAPTGEIFRIIKRNDFFNHISAGELLEDHPEYTEQSGWSFTVYPEKLKIYMGDPKPLVIPLDPNVDIGFLKKSWYLRYCEHVSYTYAYHSES